MPATNLTLAVFLCLASIAFSQSPSPVSPATPSSQPVPSGASSTTEQTVTGQTVTTNATQPSVTPQQTRQSPLKNIYINTQKPSRGIYITKSVYSDGVLSPAFNSCDPSENVSSCYQDDAYNDRLRFQLSFQIDPEIIDFALSQNPPTVSTDEKGSSIAAPTISNVFVNDDGSSGIVEVYYQCQTNAHGTVQFHLSLYLGPMPEDALEIRWEKLCANGPNDKMKFGYLSGDYIFGNVEQHQFGHDTTALLTVLPSDVSTEFFLQLEEEGASQLFHAPYILSSDPDIVTVTVRGNHPQGGILEGTQLTSFQIGYDCHSVGEATIETNIGIPPFNNISATWKKDCGGNLATNLQVGTVDGGFDVVDNGKATPRYMVAIDNIGADHSEEHLHLPDNQTEWVFYVKNGDMNVGSSSDSALHVSRISATVEQPGVVFPQKPIMFEWVPGKWIKAEKSSYALGGGRTMKVVLPLVCREIGESRILITVPVLGHQELEFGIAKECEHVGVSRRSNQFILTVSNLFWGGVFIFICLIGGLFIKSRYGSKAVGFEPVSLVER